MPTKVFNELDKSKQDKIIESAIKEFAEYGYEEGSTNRIVKDCGISKGSLFKYFENKEELYAVRQRRFARPREESDEEV